MANGQPRKGGDRRGVEWHRADRAASGTPPVGAGGSPLLLVRVGSARRRGGVREEGTSGVLVAVPSEVLQRVRASDGNPMPASLPGLDLPAAMGAATAGIWRGGETGERSACGRTPSVRGRTMKRILVPLDGYRLSEAIIPVAAELARDHDAELVLLRALRPQGPTEAQAEVQERAEEYLSRMARKRRLRELPAARWSICCGEPVQAIVDAAVANEVDLIAIATHGRGGLSRVLLGSVAESVVRRAPAPVLLIRGQPSWRPGGIEKILVPLDGSELSEGILHDRGAPGRPLRPRHLSHPRDRATPSLDDGGGPRARR